ncbi:unnamed protein product [Rotaria sp. Silwood2]|nr:unnamed protein product [Rotaria sp. Silwood2]CAF4245519.1 unnamed protein product [Rotaria sp. Silwood2]
MQPSDEYSDQMENAARKGIPKCLNCLNIAIVGAGVSGLTAAVELALAGHSVTVYEASNRTGGRIFTYRHPTGGYMTELGAMRLPLDVHTLLQIYIQERFNLNFQPFINVNDNGFVYLNDMRQTVADAKINPAGFHFNVSPDEFNQRPEDLWAKAVEPLLIYLEEEGPEKFAETYAAFSIDQYLNSVNMSRAAIDFIGLMFGIETNLHLAITESIFDMKIQRDDTNFSHIIGGNDRITDSLRDRCLVVPNNRCSIVFDARVSNVTYASTETPKNVQLTWRDSSFNQNISKKYDSLIVATTATAANMIEFTPRRLFVDKYRTMRQVHYDCASKIALFFKEPWWKTRFAITGGRSTTDLPVRAVYYHNFNANASATDGAAILASYTWAMDSLVWQSLPDNSAVSLALDNLNMLHAQVDVYQSLVGYQIKHWCDDNYSHGAFCLFTPFQERDLKNALQQSIDGRIHFIGEHTSSAHGWIEGAILSALRVVMNIQEESFDVVIVGGGPIGLFTAIRLASIKSGIKIAIIEQFQIGNQNGSSYENVKQFRQPHSELYLAELAKISIPLWRQLEQNASLDVGSILNLKDGFLIIGDPVANLTTVEGNYAQIQQNCIELDMGCEFLSSTEVSNRYPLFHMLSNYHGIFHSQSGYINVTQMMMALVQIIQRNYSQNIIIREQEEFLNVDQSVLDIPQYEVRLLTSRGSLRAKKVVFAPGPYAKNVSDALGFDLQMTMWELPDLYFALRSPQLSLTIPTWFAVGSDVQSHFHGYPMESSVMPGYVKISPEFIKNMNNPLVYPKDRQNATEYLLQYFIEQAQQWIDANAPQLNRSDYRYGPQTCLATFVPDNGFIIDYLPSQVKYHDKIMMYAAGWGMKFVPVFADILVNLIFDTIPTSPYSKYMPKFSLDIENRVIPYLTTNAPKSTTSASTPDTSERMPYMVAMIALCLVVGILIIPIVFLSKAYYKSRQGVVLTDRSGLMSSI